MQYPFLGLFISIFNAPRISRAITANITTRPFPLAGSIQIFAAVPPLIVSLILAPARQKLLCPPCGRSIQRPSYP